MADVPMNLLCLKQLLTTETRLVVVDCYADWCGPCKRIAPEVEKLESQFNVCVVKVNIDECDDIAQEFGITSLPTFLFFKEGRLFDKNIGADMNAVRSKIQLYHK